MSSTTRYSTDYVADGVRFVRDEVAVAAPLIIFGHSLGAMVAADAVASVSALSSCKHVRFSGSGHQLHRYRRVDVLQAFQDFATSFHSSNNTQATDHP